MERTGRVVLVVDGDAVRGTNTASRLRHQGYRTQTAQNSRDAIADVFPESNEGQPQVDLIVMDIDLGDVDGVETARTILERGDIPIIFVSSHFDESLLERLRGITRYGLIAKECGDVDLLSSIEMAFDLFDVHMRTKAGEKQYRQLVESIHDVIYEIAADGTVLYVSPVVKSLFGYSPEEIVGRNVQEFVHPDDAQRLRDGLPLAMNEKDEPAGFRFRTRTGEYRWVLTHAREAHKESSDSTAIGSMADITDSVPAREALVESENRLERAEQIAHVGNWELDFSTGKVHGSAEARRIYGLEDREWTIEEIQQIPMPEYRDLIERALSDLMDNAQPYKVEYKIRRHADNAIRDVRAVAEYDRRKNTMFGIIQDITEHIRIRHEAQRSQEYLYAVLNAVNEAVFVLDKRNVQILDANGTACHMYGYGREELLTKCFHDLSADEQPCTADLLIEKLSDAQDSHLFEWTAKTNDDRSFPVELNVRAAAIGAVERFIVTVRDISMRKKTEQEITNLLQEKDMILKEVHHRIKNNIAVVASLLSLQAARIVNTPAHAAIVEAQSRVRTVGALYEKLYRSTDFQHVDAKEYLEDLAGDIFHTIDVADPHVSIELHIDVFRISARNCVPLGLILNELLTNAVKHAFAKGERDSAKGTVVVTCTNRDQSVVLSVRDNGKGMPESTNTTRDRGLGLTIVEALVHQLSGTMSTRSDSTGTEFSISFPHMAE